MRVPLRFQITEFDCGTVSLTNAISYLFDRKDIPAELIRAISTYTLDCYDEHGNLGHGGTSREAVEMLTNWIVNYSKHHDFKIKCEHYRGDKVDIDSIRKVVENGGVAFVRLWQSVEHYVIITAIDKENVYIFDSYYLDETEYDKDDMVTMVFDEPFKYNRIVKIERLIQETEEDFALGKKDRRDCVLISKVTK